MSPSPQPQVMISAASSAPRSFHVKCRSFSAAMPRGHEPVQDLALDVGLVPRVGHLVERGLPPVRLARVLREQADAAGVVQADVSGAAVVRGVEDHLEGRHLVGRGRVVPAERRSSVRSRRWHREPPVARPPGRGTGSPRSWPRRQAKIECDPAAAAVGAGRGAHGRTLVRALADRPQFAGVTHVTRMRGFRSRGSRRTVRGEGVPDPGSTRDARRRMKARRRVVHVCDLMGADVSRVFEIGLGSEPSWRSETG
jgi:hypothetical protein